MKVTCLHGFYIFEETEMTQVSDFVRLSGFDLVMFEGGYTFRPLASAPTVSIKGGRVLDAEATVNYEGKPWEVFQANGLVYDFTQKKVRPIGDINHEAKVQPLRNRWSANGLLLAGSTTDQGRVASYQGFYSRRGVLWDLTGVRFV